MSKIEKNPIHKVIIDFATDVDSLRTSAILTGFIMHNIAKDYSLKFKEFLETLESSDKGSEKTTYIVPAEKGHVHRKVEDEFNRAVRAAAIVPRSFVVSLVSQYDAFLSSLVRTLFTSKPDLVNSTKRTIEFSELLTFGSIEDATNAVVDSEIEGLLRESHHQQFVWLENKFEIRTLRELSVWPEFVELTQRRNLFVHSDGKVSKQYLKVCQEHGVKLSADLKFGDQLEVDVSYTRRCSAVLFEIAVKLTQVLWRKILPGEIEAADESLNDIGYHLIVRKRYKLATALLDFGFETVKRHSNPEWKLRLLINRANAHRLIGNNRKCLELLETEDWRAYDIPFRLAAHVLRGEKKDVMTCMKSIGTTGPVSKNSYRVWPLFLGLREDPEFVQTFREIFNEDVVEAEVISPENQDDDSASASARFDLEVFEEDDGEIKKTIN
jgi:hypothetical protein